MPRLLIVSNRLPVTVRSTADGVSVKASSGGLATGMKGPHELMGGLWIGWPGELEGLPPEARANVDQQLAELHLVPVALTANELARYYENYSNAVFTAGQAWSNDGQNHKVVPYATKSDYGFSLGGPVRIPKVYNGKNRFFFFISWSARPISKKSSLMRCLRRAIISRSSSARFAHTINLASRAAAT